MIAHNQPSLRYRELQAAGANSLQRTLMVYDAAIVACGRQDLQRTTEALNVLRNSLDLEQGPIPVSLFRIYQYCGKLAREGRYDEAADMLRELVQAWVEVLVREKDARMQKVAGEPASFVAVG